MFTLSSHFNGCLPRFIIDSRDHSTLFNHAVREENSEEKRRGVREEKETKRKRCRAEKETESASDVGQRALGNLDRAARAVRQKFHGGRYSGGPHTRLSRRTELVGVPLASGLRNPRKKNSKPDWKVLPALVDFKEKLALHS